MTDWAEKYRAHALLFAGLPVRVQNTLLQAGIESVEALANNTLIELQRKKNMGPKGIALINAFLAARGLALRAPGSQPACLCVQCPIHRGTAPAPAAPNGPTGGGGVEVPGGTGVVAGDAGVERDDEGGGAVPGSTS